MLVSTLHEPRRRECILERLTDQGGCRVRLIRVDEKQDGFRGVVHMAGESCDRRHPRDVRPGQTLIFAGGGLMQRLRSAFPFPLEYELGVMLAEFFLGCPRTRDCRSYRGQGCDIRG